MLDVTLLGLCVVWGLRTYINLAESKQQKVRESFQAKIHVADLCFDIETKCEQKVYLVSSTRKAGYRVINCPFRFIGV